MYLQCNLEPLGSYTSSLNGSKYFETKITMILGTMVAVNILI